MIYLAVLFGLFSPPDSLLESGAFALHMDNVKVVDASDYSVLVSVGLFHKINAYREENKLKPLKWDHQVFEAAEIHSKAMTESSFFSHTNPRMKKWKTPKDRLTYVNADFFAWAENIASFNKPKPQTVDAKEIYAWIDQLFNQWKNSKPHRASMLNETYTHSGISCYFSPVALRENRIHVNATNVFTAKK